jgi:methyltransferase (TIGR00027 family)
MTTLTEATRQLELLMPYLDAGERTTVAGRLARHLDAWPALIADARQLLADNEPADGERAKGLARRWSDLFSACYHGGDQQLAAKIHRAFAAESALAMRPGLDSALFDYVQDALQHLFSPYRSLDTSSAPKPSAFMVAVHRAVHRLIDLPLVFDDPLALTILGREEADALRANLDDYRNPYSSGLRASLSVRSRLAEEAREAAEQRGVHQYVILGAGLDTFAYRCEPHPQSRVFEVDLPATQDWKRRQLAQCAIAEPAHVCYVPVCFERESVIDALERSGFDRQAPAVFAWLGVTYYLEPAAVLRMLDMIGGLAAGSEVVFDYQPAPHCVGPFERRIMAGMAERLAARGEMLRSAFDPQELAAHLGAAGFSVMEDFDADMLNRRYLSGRQDGMSLAGVSRIMHARV